MVHMNIVGLTLDKSDQTPILVLREKNPSPGRDPRILPVWVGGIEAMSLSGVLHRLQLPQPLPHEVLMTTIRALGGRVTGTAITRLARGVFSARIDVMQNNTTSHISCRASDAVLIALHCGLDITVDESVLQTAQHDRVRPYATDLERRPLDSAEELIREAGRKVLEQTGQGPEFLERDTGFPERDETRTRPAPEQDLILAGITGPPGDETELAELLRQLEPASRRMM